jgi:hypothetical protein
LTNIDLLQNRVARLLADLGTEVAKAKHTFTVTHDDHTDDNDGVDDYQDVSNPAMSADDDTNGVDPEDDSELEDGDEEDFNTDLSKLGSGGRLVYPHAAEASYVQTHSAADRPGSLKTTSHPAYPRRTGVTAATVPAARHSFDNRVDEIKNRDAVTKQVALQRARIEFPDDYQSFQAFHAGTSTAEQRARRDGYGVNVGKSREPDLVELEMAKGCTREVAAQRIAQLHGFPGFANPTRIEKHRADLVWEFEGRVNEIMRKDRVDATEATRRARLEDWELFSAMQRAG